MMLGSPFPANFGLRPAPLTRERVSFLPRGSTRPASGRLSGGHQPAHVLRHAAGQHLVVIASFQHGQQPTV